MSQPERKQVADLHRTHWWNSVPITQKAAMRREERPTGDSWATRGTRSRPDALMWCRVSHRQVSQIWKSRRGNKKGISCYETWWYGKVFICISVTLSYYGIGGFWTPPSGNIRFHWTGSWDSHLVIIGFPTLREYLSSHCTSRASGFFGAPPTAEVREDLSSPRTQTPHGGLDYATEQRSLAHWTEFGKQRLRGVGSQEGKFRIPAVDLWPTALLRITVALIFSSCSLYVIYMY